MSILDLLKYPITNCANSDDLKPHDVNILKNWALRIARSVEGKDKSGGAKKCNDMTERLLCGEVTENDSLNALWGLCLTSSAIKLKPRSVANDTAYYAFLTAKGVSWMVAVQASRCFYVAERQANRNSSSALKRKKLYQSWLIEMIGNNNVGL